MKLRIIDLFAVSLACVLPGAVGAESKRVSCSARLTVTSELPYANVPMDPDDRLPESDPAGRRRRRARPELDRRDRRAHRPARAARDDARISPTATAAGWNG